MPASAFPFYRGALGGALGKGLLLGVVAGAVWVATRPRAGAPPALIDWQRVRSAALKLSDREPDDDLMLWPTRAELTRQYAEMVQQSEEHIGSYLGRSLPRREGSTYVFDRREWIEANLAGFRLLFEPIERINREALGDGTVGTHLVGSVNQVLISGQLGMLVGYLSRRVLGQYDTSLLGREPITNGRLYFVEPNIARLQARLGLPPREFRLWIALHETTHAYEFEGHPWVREHMNALLTRYFDSLSRDLLGLRQRPGGLVGLAERIGGNARRAGHALELVMTDEQREIFRQLQALMCLLEGYSNHVMDQVGQALLPSYPVMKARFEERNRHKTFADRILARLTGLDVKLEQYRLGERFVGEVVRQRGVDFANRVWASPEALPTLDEIKQPQRWIDRAAVA